MSEIKPNWVDNGNNVEEGGVQVEDYDESAAPNATVTSTPTGGVNISAIEDENKPSGTTCLRIFLNSVSCCLLVIFVYSAVVQGNDLENSRMWKFFYAMSAAVAGAYVGTKLFCNSAASLIEKPMGLLIFGMVVWSTVLLIFASIEVATDDPDVNGSSKEGGDSDNFTDSTEKALEVAGAGLCLFSALFHMVLLRCC